MVWSCPALSVGIATLNALLGSGPCRNTAMSCWEEALEQNTHPLEVKWQNPSLFTCFSTAFLGAQGFQQGQVTFRVSALQGELCVWGAQGSPAGRAWGASAAVTHRPCSVPRVSHIIARVGMALWTLHQLHLVPLQVRDVRALPHRSVLQNLCTSKGPRRSVARWQWQLLVRTVTVPGSHHFTAQNKALTLLLQFWL